MLNLVDEERIAIRPAYELSFLNDKQQEMLLKVIEELDATPSLSQAKFFKELAQDDELVKKPSMMNYCRKNQIKRKN